MFPPCSPKVDNPYPLRLRAQCQELCSRRANRRSCDDPLYLGVIGLLSEWLGCEVEDFAIVVLAHELARAYTQLGAEIEGLRWPASLFARAKAALPKQCAAYRAHEPW